MRTTYPLLILYVLVYRISLRNNYYSVPWYIGILHARGKEEMNARTPPFLDLEIDVLSFFCVRYIPYISQSFWLAE